MFTGDLTFENFDSMVNQWIIETDDLVDTFQYQIQDLNKLYLAVESNTDKLKNINKKGIDLIEQTRQLECDLHWTAEIMNKIECLLPRLEQHVDLMNYHQQPNDYLREPIYNITENIFIILTQIKCVLEQSPGLPDLCVSKEVCPASAKPLPSEQLSRIMHLEFTVLETIDKKIEKITKWLENIECQKRCLQQKHFF